MNGESLMNRAWEANVRVGEVIHVRGATVDVEVPAGAFTEFLDDAALTTWTAARFLPLWPKYKARMKALVEEWERERKHDRRAAEQQFHCLGAEFFHRHCPKQFLVRIEHQVQRCIKPGARFPLGSWASGWGYLQSVWLLADTVEEAIEEGIEIADVQRREAFQVAKKGAKRAKAGAL